MKEMEEIERERECRHGKDRCTETKVSSSELKKKLVSDG